MLHDACCEATTNAMQAETATNLQAAVGRTSLVVWRGVIELVEGRAAVLESSSLGSRHRVHAGKRGHVLKQLVGNHTEGVDIHFGVVGLMAEDLGGHVAVGPRLPRQLEGRLQVVAGVLVHWHGLGQAKVCKLDGASVVDQALPAAMAGW